LVRLNGLPQSVADFPPGDACKGHYEFGQGDDDYATLHGVQSDEHDRLRWLVAVTRHRAELAVARSTCLRRQSPSDMVAALSRRS